jgi:hypothetical protein
MGLNTEFQLDWMHRRGRFMVGDKKKKGKKTKNSIELIAWSWGLG